MNAKQLVVLPLIFASSAALAQQTLEAVEVRAESEQSLVIACDNPRKPSLKDVERVLGVSDPAEAPGLRTRLMGAAAEACTAGVAKIQVARGASNSLTWKAMR